MKTGMALNDVAAELERQIGAMEDFVADTRHLGFHAEKGETATLSIDDAAEDGGVAEFEITDRGHNQIGGRIGMPAKFYDRLLSDHPDLLTHNIMTLWQREPEDRLIRTLDGKVRAFLSDRYRPLDNYDLYHRAILPALGQIEGQVFSSALTDARLYIKLVFPDIKFDVGDGRGDVSPGLSISNSEVGAGALAVEPFTYTWACKNGMIMGLDFGDFGLRKAHLGRRISDESDAAEIYSRRTRELDDAAFFSTVYDVVKGAVGGISWLRITERLQELTGIRVKGSPVKAVQKLAKRHALTEDEQEQISLHLAEGGDLSAYGWVQAVTRTAEDAEGYDRATELERIGGQLFEMPAAQWAVLAV